MFLIKIPLVLSFFFAFIATYLFVDNARVDYFGEKVEGRYIQSDDGFPVFAYNYGGMPLTFKSDYSTGHKFSPGEIVQIQLDPLDLKDSMISTDDRLYGGAFLFFILAVCFAVVYLLIRIKVKLIQRFFPRVLRDTGYIKAEFNYSAITKFTCLSGFILLAMDFQDYKILQKGVRVLAKVTTIKAPIRIDKHFRPTTYEYTYKGKTYSFRGKFDFSPGTTYAIIHIDPTRPIRNSRGIDVFSIFMALITAPAALLFVYQQLKRKTH